MSGNITKNYTCDGKTIAPEFQKGCVMQNPNVWGELRGRDVQSARGTKAGTIQDVVVDPQTGNVRYVVLSRTIRTRQGFSAIGAFLLFLFVAGLFWVTFEVSTRGWEQARQEVTSTLQGAAYAAKETSLDAALSAKVKTALSLSKRVPAGQISVDADGPAVTLRGEVPSEQVREIAESIARDVPGVAEVRNHLFPVAQSK